MTPRSKRSSESSSENAGGQADQVTIDELLVRAIDGGASDLHVSAGLQSMLRVNGRLESLDGPRLTPEDTRRLIHSILSDDQRARLEDEWELDFAYSLPGRGRFRVNVYMQRGSVGAAFRHIPAKIASVPDLGLPIVLHELARKPRGFVVVTGPTGSGKSTTLAAMIDHINESADLHVMTIEDPIEYLHEHKRSMVHQREVGSDTKTFATALKYILRQDPDVVLVGEMRDLETISAALTAAETGHLVLATLHTQGAAQTVDRIIDVFPPHQQQQVRVQLAATLQGVVSQQLLPAADGRGRVVACEVLIPTSAVRNLIREGKTHQLDTVMQTGQHSAMMTMDKALVAILRRGMITKETALQRAVDPEVLKVHLAQ